MNHATAGFKVKSESNSKIRGLIKKSLLSLIILNVMKVHVDIHTRSTFVNLQDG